MADIEVPVTISTTIGRPQECDADLKNICNSIAFQNSSGNLLVECEIKRGQIILKYDKYQCQKI